MKILHILRAPIGGLFRHVRDLAEQQIAEGHDVGFITAPYLDNDYAKDLCLALETKLSLGITQLNIRRLPSITDYKNVKTILKLVNAEQIDIVHGHGAKGGAYVRLLKRSQPNAEFKVFYTLHGGSLHYRRSSPIGFVFLKLEEYLQKHTDGFIFESENSKRLFEINIAKLSKPNKVIYNGLQDSEFTNHSPIESASDFLYIGELRMLKGIDLLINALAKVSKGKATKPTLTIVGYGPDEAEFKAMVAKAGLYAQVTFLPPMPAASAFELAKVQVMPSRAEGLPYMVLETLATKMPLIASNVGGIPEIYGENSHLLFNSEDETALAELLENCIKNDAEQLKKVIELSDFVKTHFNVHKMAQEITDFYTN